MVIDLVPVFRVGLLSGTTNTAKSFQLLFSLWYFIAGYPAAHTLGPLSLVRVDFIVFAQLKVGLIGVNQFRA